METEMERLSAQGQKILYEKEGGNFRDRDGDDDDDEDEMLSFCPEEEQAVLKKLNWRVVGLIAFLYLLSFLDRSSEYRPFGFDIHHI